MNEIKESEIGSTLAATTEIVIAIDNAMNIHKYNHLLK